MHIITRKRLREAVEEHPDARSSLESWRRVAQSKRWATLVDVRQDWRTADLVGALTIFNISGNKYRLITYIDYQRGKVFIRGRLLTHAEYDKGEWKHDPWF